MAEIADGPSSSSTSKAAGPLLEKLKRKWAEGNMSAIEVQDMALAAEGQGATGMRGMSSMGSSGSHPQNCFRALKNLLGMPAGAPSVTWIKIPTIHGDTDHPFLLPHEFFAAYFKGQFRKWAFTMGGPENAALEFWKGIQASEFVARHPDLRRATWAQTIPLGFHGDGASFSKQDSVYTFSWNSLVGSGTTMQKRFIATVIKKTDFAEGTMDFISRVLAWSFNSILTGKTPSVNWNGDPWEGGGATLAGGWMGRFVPSSGRLGFLLRTVPLSPVEQRGPHVLAVPGEFDKPGTCLGQMGG